MPKVHYAYSPPMDNLDREQPKVCRRCGADFVTRSRVKKRCDVCQEAVTAAKQPVYAERGKARKAGRRG